ncbi:hypothetical protein [Variovorax gossypii]
MAQASGKSGKTRFRPPTEADFSRRAKSLSAILDHPLQATQNLLARIYGYMDLHDLQLQLKKPGDPGPYEDLQELAPQFDNPALGGWLPRLVAELSNREVALRDVRTLELVFEETVTVDSNLPDWRRQAACAAGLFCTPPKHRQAAAEVLEAIGEFEDFGYLLPSTRKLTLRGRAALVDQAFLKTRKVNKIGEFESAFGRRWSEFDPLNHFWATRQQYACNQYLAAREDTEEDTHPWLTGDTLFDEGLGFPDLIEVLTDEDWVSNLTGISLTQAFEGYFSEDEKIASEWLDSLTAFLACPSAEAVEGHPLLRVLPDPVGLARAWPEFRFAALHDACKAEVDFHWSHSEIAGVPVTAAVALVESDESTEDLGIKLYEFQAVFLQPAKRAGEMDAIAAMTGVLVDCFHPSYGLASADTIFWGMDAHSAMLNDVWKALNFTHAREQGFESLHEMLEAHLEEDWTPNAAFALVGTTVIAPSLRGKGLLVKFLSAFLSALDEPGVGALMVDGDELDDDDDDDSERAGVQASPVALIFPVEGTKPKGTLTGSFHLVASPVKLEVGPRDTRVELRREKLAKHFKSMETELGVDVVVYNPWDYPIT